MQLPFLKSGSARLQNPPYLSATVPSDQTNVGEIPAAALGFPNSPIQNSDGWFVLLPLGHVVGIRRANCSFSAADSILARVAPNLQNVIVCCNL